MSCFTCLRSFVLLLFTFSHTGHTYLCVEAIANTVWLVDSHQDIFAPFSLWAALMHIHDVCVYWLLVATVTTSRSGCHCILQRFLSPLKCIKLLVYFERLMRLVMLVFECSCDLCGNVTPLHGLLVVVQSLWLVVLVFEECCELCGEILLYVVGCLLLCDHYDWSYWFSKNVLNFTGRYYSSL